MLYGVEAQASHQFANPSLPTAGGGVHFIGGGGSFLSCDALSCPDSGWFSFSFWTNGLSDPINNGLNFFVADPDGNYSPFAQIFFFQFGYGSSTTRTQRSYDPLVDVTGGSGWHHILGSTDVDTSAGNQIVTLYFDDVLQAPNIVHNASGPVLNLIDGLKFVFGDDTFSSGPACDFADVWIAPGIKLHETDGSILEANRRIFTDYTTAGGPVPIDPTTFPSSAILFSGNAAAFPINRGTGGAFTLTGILTDAATDPP